MFTKPDHKESYKFKYTYLVLILFLILAIVITYVLPGMFPNLFQDSHWIIAIDNAGKSSIQHISESLGMIILDIIRNIFVSAFVGIILYAFYEHRFEKEEKQAMLNSVNTILLNHMDEHIAASMLSSKEICKSTLSGEFVDEILINCLERKVGDPKKAIAIMKSLVENVINKTGTIQNLVVSMTLSNFKDKKHIYCAYSVYKMTYVIQYKAFLDANCFKFILTNSKEIQNKHLGSFIFCQFVDSSFSGTQVYFKVNEVTIDGQSLHQQGNRLIEKTYITEQYWDKSCNSKKGKEVQVCYSVEFLVRKKGNHYSYFTPCMTYGIDLKFDAAQTDIKRIKLLTYFNSGEKPTILPPLGTENNPKTIEINLNDWVLPSSGASFIWQYEEK